MFQSQDKKKDAEVAKKGMTERNEKAKVEEISRNSSIRRSKRNSRANSRASRASMPMDLGSAAAVAKDAFSEIDEFDEENLVFSYFVVSREWFQKLKDGVENPGPIENKQFI